MKFETKKDGGRILYAAPAEMFCSSCRKPVKPRDSSARWYYFDYDKRLLCFDCILTKNTPLIATMQKANYWLIDEFRYDEG